MSTFQNIFVSDTATISSVVCDTLTTNSAISTDTYGGTTVKTNTIIPYTGSSVSVNSANLNVSGNLTVNKNCFLAQSNTASQVILSTSGEYTFIDLHSHSNIANIFPDTRLLSYGGLSNTVATGTFQISSRNLHLGGGLFAPSSGAGNLLITYQSANIQNEAYCKNILEVDGNILGRANLQVNRNANIVGNLTVGNVLIGNQLTNTANINCANINANGGIITGNLQVGNLSTTANISIGNVISNFANINNVFIGSSASYTATSGTALIISQNTTFDNTVTGTISGNVYPQFSFGGGREHIFSTDVNDSSIAYYGISGGGVPDSDYFITYKRGTGMKISPTNTTENFTEALRVIGTSNITGNSLFGSNVEIIGNLDVDTSANIVSLTGSGNTIVGYNTLNRKIKMGAIDATTQRISFYASSNITAENMNGYIEIDAETNGATTQNRGVLNMVCGNITMGSVNGQSFILYNKNAELQGNVNILSKLDVLGDTNVAMLNFTDIKNTNVRIADCWGPIFLGTPTIPNGQYVPFGATVVGTLDQIDTTNKWIRINKNGQSLTVGVKVTLTFEINTGFTNTTTGAFQVQTSTTSAFTVANSRTLARVIGAFTSSQVVERTLDFILPTTEEYFRVIYNGNATWSFVGGAANAYLSRYSVRTYF